MASRWTQSVFDVSVDSELGAHNNKLPITLCFGDVWCERWIGAEEPVIDQFALHVFVL